MNTSYYNFWFWQVYQREQECSWECFKCCFCASDVQLIKKCLTVSQSCFYLSAKYVIYYRTWFTSYILKCQCPYQVGKSPTDDTELELTLFSTVIKMCLFTSNSFCNSKKQVLLMPLHFSTYHMPSHIRNIIHTYNQSEQSITICSNKTHTSQRSSPVHSCALSPYPQVLQTHMHWFCRVYHLPELLSHQELE